MYKCGLLIDDNYIDNYVTRRILESGNFAEEIVVRQSANDAIASIKSGSVIPDVIFLDLRMPTMNGFDFLREYDKVDIPDKKRIKRSAENKYITQFIHKPITHKILEELV